MWTGAEEVSETKKAGGPSERDYRVAAGSRWVGAWKIPAGVGALGLGIAAWGCRLDPTRFAFAYLFAFFVALSVALGSLFFILVLYITKASWGVTVRRVAELFVRPMALFAVLVIPLIFTMGQLFPWLGTKASAGPEGRAESAEHADATPLAEARGFPEREPVGLRDLPIANAKRMQAAEESAEASIVDHKRFFLNKRFVLVRLVGYLLIWWWLADRYFRWSVEQDETKAVQNTAAAQRFAPVALILFALTLTFFSFDWLLSLDATWYSTIFGVYTFAQCALVQMAVLILSALALRKSGLLGGAVNVEHFHDMGKLLFGWIVFWSYIAFAQFFLTWYSNIPDEVAWFHKRWDDNGGTWMGLSLALVALHFFVPFWFLMSRNIKRRLPLLAAGAACMVLMHIAEVYWVVMPNFGPLEPSLLDLGCLLGVVGVYLAVVLRGIEDYALIPVGDPRLVRALEFENA
jgi:hypothetical protein